MSSGFITESEAIDKRRKRQEEWERVRKPSDPIERPEEAYDGRSLFDRLHEQKQKKDMEYEEAHKLKNMIKGLDDDEIDFLDLVDQTKLAADRQKSLEEEQELNDYRNRVASLQEAAHDQRLGAAGIRTPATATATTTAKQHLKRSQMKLLQGAVVTKKNHSGSCAAKKRKAVSPTECDDRKAATAMRCIGILPGLGCYNDTTSDDSSNSDSDIDTAVPVIPVDFLGRKIQCKEVQQS